MNRTQLEPVRRRPLLLFPVLRKNAPQKLLVDTVISKGVFFVFLLVENGLHIVSTRRKKNLEKFWVCPCPSSVCSEWIMHRACTCCSSDMQTVEHSVFLPIVDENYDEKVERPNIFDRRKTSGKRISNQQPTAPSFAVLVRWCCTGRPCGPSATLPATRPSVATSS